ncbi:MAG: RNA polymerase sigma factor [Gemmataceae bacterium]
MSAEPLDDLLEKLTSGDDAAAERVFRAYEPYLRMVVRRRLSPELRAKFDSVDIVQSVWVHVLRRFRVAGWRFASVAQLRAFLVQLTRHRFLDRLRQVKKSVEREEPLGPGQDALLWDSGPQPSEVAEADELWEQLLGLCPPAHHELLRLKREGALTGEVAARTGLNEGSVRRILSALSGRLARKRGEAGA